MSILYYRLRLKEGCDKKKGIVLMFDVIEITEAAFPACVSVTGSCYCSCWLTDAPKGYRASIDHICSGGASPAGTRHNSLYCLKYRLCVTVSVWGYHQFGVHCCCSDWCIIYSSSTKGTVKLYDPRVSKLTILNDGCVWMFYL